LQRCRRSLLALLRPDQSAREISGLPPVGTTEREVWIRAHAVELAPETLVFLLREAAAAGNTALFEVCGAALIDVRGTSGGWCEGIIGAVASETGFRRDREVFRDFRGACYEAMWRAIHGGSNEEGFWEERFGRALRCRCIDVARQMGRAAKKENDAVLASLDSGAELLPDSTGDVAMTVWDRIVVGDLTAAIRRLPPHQARAAFLRFVEGRPVEGEHSGSIRNVLGVTDREVYKLLAEARERLAQDPEIRKYRR
jgi:DNA-directed RNA polymerase specialized sigma24 family protein